MKMKYDADTKLTAPVIVEFIMADRKPVRNKYKILDIL